MKNNHPLLTPEEVNLALRRLGELEIATNKLEGELTLRTNQLKAEFQTRSEDILKERRDMDWIDELTIDQMPTDTMRDVAEVCGLETARQLLRNFAGCRLEIPRIGVRRALPDLVKQYWSGNNARDLARRFGVTERQIQVIVRQNALSDQDQPTLF